MAFAAEALPKIALAAAPAMDAISATFLLCAAADAAAADAADAAFAAAALEAAACAALI